MTRERMLTSMLPPEIRQTVFLPATGSLPNSAAATGVRARAFGHELLVFHQRQDGRGDLVLADRDNIVNILFDDLYVYLLGVLTAMPSAKVSTASSVS